MTIHGRHSTQVGILDPNHIGESAIPFHGNHFKVDGTLDRNGNEI
jgi:hypothetical protein